MMVPSIQCPTSQSTQDRLDYSGINRTRDKKTQPIPKLHDSLKSFWSYDLTVLKNRDTHHTGHRAGPCNNRTLRPPHSDCRQIWPRDQNQFPKARSARWSGPWSCFQSPRAGSFWCHSPEQHVGKVWSRLATPIIPRESPMNSLANEFTGRNVLIHTGNLEEIWQKVHREPFSTANPEYSPGKPHSKKHTQPMRKQKPTMWPLRPIKCLHFCRSQFKHVRWLKYSF